MYDEIPYKYKYMLNKIIRCLLDYISKNLNDKPLLESKLLLINNYILDIFKHSENSRNKNRNINSQISNTKTYDDRVKMPELEKNVNLSKISNILLGMNKYEINNNTQRKTLLPYKDKNTNMKLKRLLKNEKDKSSLKELFYLKKLSFVEEKLNYYESTINKMNNIKNINDIDRNISSMFIEKEKNMKEKVKDINLSNNLDDLTIINNSCKMKRINLFKNESVPNYSKRNKFSISQGEFNNKKNIKKQILNKARSSKYFYNGDKFIDIIKSKYIVVKPKLIRVKSTS